MTFWMYGLEEPPKPEHFTPFTPIMWLFEIWGWLGKNKDKNQDPFLS